MPQKEFLKNKIAQKMLPVLSSEELTEAGLLLCDTSVPLA